MIFFVVKLSWFRFAGALVSGCFLSFLIYFKALRVDFFVFFVLGYSWFGVVRGLIYKGGYVFRYVDLVFGFFDEFGGFWGYSRKTRGSEGSGRVVGILRGYVDRFFVSFDYGGITWV